MGIIKHNNFEGLIDNVYQTHCLLQQNAQKAVNRNLTMRNWLVGYYIVEFEQNGEDRAKYGARLLEEMAKRIKVKGIKGFNLSTLRNCRIFYNTYPQIRQTVSTELKKVGENVGKKLFFSDLQIRQTVSAELQKSFPIPIRGSVSRELPEEYPIPSETLLSRLSFSHFLEIIRKDDPLERLFYEVETIKNNWSVRELERAMNTALYVRTGLSKDKEAVIRKFKNQKPAQNEDVIRDPYFLEFLGLEERSSYSESELEEAILNHLQQFLIELGTGFCFEGCQKRITFDNTHYRIDLVFYHRILAGKEGVGRVYPEGIGKVISSETED